MKSGHRLSKEGFRKANLFLKTMARPLERAMFEYKFEAGASSQVIDCLGAFQNEDGGFGNSLEPDLRTPTSSSLATSMALHILTELQCPQHHSMVQTAVQFLLTTFNPQENTWRVVPTDSNKHPHAPWWNDKNGSLAKTFDNFNIIPRAEILASLIYYRDLVPPEWLKHLTSETVAHIEDADPLGTGGGDDLVYAIRLAEAEFLSPHHKQRLSKKIRSITPNIVTRESKKWSSYSIPPLKVAPAPRSIVRDLLEQDIQRHLDFQIDHQTTEGSWDPVWSWGEHYPEAWEQARREWQGILTLDTLTSLKGYGRID
jgi:hypothetical protein